MQSALLKLLYLYGDVRNYMLIPIISQAASIYSIWF